MLDVDAGFKSLLHEMVWSVTLSAPATTTDAAAASPYVAAGRAMVIDVLRRLLDVSANPLTPSLAQVALVDVLWLAWTELESIKREESAAAAAAAASSAEAAPAPAPALIEPAARDRLVGFVMELQSVKRVPTSDLIVSADPTTAAAVAPANVLSPRALRETLQPDFLDALGVFAAALLAKQSITTRTAAWYRQQKFNLLREESEGFSKLFAELTTFFQLSANQVNVALMQRKVLSFIGYFDLDPNRVIDVLLDAFERSGCIYSASGHLGNFLHLIDGFEAQHVVQILGFKFRNYYESVLSHQAALASGVKQPQQSLGPAPQSLFDVAAILLKTGRITIEGLYPHLSPSDELMALARSDLLIEEKAKVKRMNVVSLAKGSTDEEPIRAQPSAADKKRDASSTAPSASGLANVASSVRNEQSIVGAGTELPKEEISLVLAGTPVAALQTIVVETSVPAAAAPAVKEPAAPVPPPKTSIRNNPQTAPAAAAAAAVAAAASSAAAPVAPSPITHPPNQKFLLVASLLNQNAFLHAEGLLRHLQSVNPAANASLGMGLVDFAARLLRRFYLPIAADWRKFSKGKPAMQPVPQGDASTVLVSPLLDASQSVNALPPASDPSFAFFQNALLTDAQMEELCATEGAPSLDAYYSALPPLLRVLKWLGIYLCNDAMLWSRLCRVMSWMMRAQKARDGPKAVVTAPAVLAEFSLHPLLESLLADTLLPAFSLMTSCHGLSEELWSVLKQLPFELRYRLYGHWQSTVYDSHPELQQQRSSILSRARYFRKRIAAAKVKECSRLILKFSENNPILVFDLLLQQIQAFDNMIGPVTDSMKLMHPLAFDAVSWVLLTQLSQSKAKLSDDGVNETHWLQSLSSFAGTLCQKYSHVEMAPLIYYVLKQLQSDESHDLLLLKELLIHMSNIEIHEDVSDLEMEGRAGGALLRAETTTVRDKVKVKDKLIKVLGDTLQKHKLNLPLWVAIAQQKSFITFRYDSEHVKLLSELLDKGHEALLHLSAFLDQTIRDDTIYAQQFTNIATLVRDYRIKPNDAFHALRRVIHLRDMQGTEDESKEEMEERQVAKGAAMEDESSSSTAVAAAAAASPYSLLVRSVRSFLPETTWHSLTPDFYALFWRLSLSQLHCPKSTYAAHAAKLKSLLPALDNPTLSSGIAKTEAQKKACKIERDRITKTIAALSVELTVQTELVAKEVEQLTAQKDTWFAGLQSPNLSMATFLHVCLLPRVLHSGIDAHFCSRFIRLLLKWATPGFFYLELLEALFKLVGPVISSSSVNEASRFGRFLKEVMHDLHRIAYDEAAYEAASKAAPACFASVLGDVHSPPTSFSSMQVNIMKWHLRLSKAIDRCLAGSNTSKMEINNALLVLCKVGTEFPRTYTQGEKIEKLLDSIIHAEENKNSAIKLLATRSHAQMQAQKKSWTKDAAQIKREQAAAAEKARLAAAKTAAKGDAATPASASADSKKPAAANGSAASSKPPSGSASSSRAPVAPAPRPSAGSAASSSASGKRGDDRRDDRGGDQPRSDSRNSATPRSSPTPEGGRIQQRGAGGGRDGDGKGSLSERDRAVLERDRKPASDGAAGGGGGGERGMKPPTIRNPHNPNTGGSGGAAAASAPGSASRLNPKAREFSPSPAKPGASGAAPASSSADNSKGVLPGARPPTGSGYAGATSAATSKDSASSSSRDDRRRDDDKRDNKRDGGGDRGARADDRGGRASSDKPASSSRGDDSKRDDRRGGEDRRNDNQSHGHSHSRSRGRSPAAASARDLAGGAAGSPPPFQRDLSSGSSNNKNAHAAFQQRDLMQGGAPGSGAGGSKRKRDDDASSPNTSATPAAAAASLLPPDAPASQQQQQASQQPKRARHDGGGGGGHQGGGHQGGGGGNDRGGHRGQGGGQQQQQGGGGGRGGGGGGRHRGGDRR